MSTSSYHSTAQKLLDSVRGQKHSFLQLEEKAIALAALILFEATHLQTHAEKSRQQQLARMMNDPLGKDFTTAMTDQCFKSDNNTRIADQLVYLLNHYGIPHYLSLPKRAGLKLFQKLGKSAPELFVPMVRRLLREETATVILPGEAEELAKHMAHRQKEHVRINLNHLGEAILGEEEALKRLQSYCEDLQKPDIDYISVKISTICSQINLLAKDKTFEVLAERLRILYRTACEHPYRNFSGQQRAKFVNLDMEEYRDLHVTIELFCRVLSEPEFKNYSAGIVLQAYLPDAFVMQQKLTRWALARAAQGGAPIKIRLVKGANLAMERLEAALRGWPQAPYTDKSSVDSNFKRMVLYGCTPEHAAAVHLGIGSHNLFDISLALLLRAQEGIDDFVCFEMLEGMADHMRRAVQPLAKEMVLYCPSATEDEFQNAIAYLVRRLDENTAPENFLHHLFGLHPNTPAWQQQVDSFKAACKNVNSISYVPRRTQNRISNNMLLSDPYQPFANEPDTDWSLPNNVQWAEGILRLWNNRNIDPIPLVVNNKRILTTSSMGSGSDPAHPDRELYRYALADAEHLETALTTGEAALNTWQDTPPMMRAQLLVNVAYLMRQQRGLLIGAMLTDGGKTIPEADTEISEAIDFAEYYLRCLINFQQLKEISFRPKGIVAVTPPWNFPCSIPAGGIIAALAAGNVVIFKPARETILVAWELVQIFWQAGISPQVLQFLPCADEPTGSLLIQDPRVAAVVLTGATATAKLFLQMRPDLDLVAETGGKNSMIITDLADRDLAIKELLASAFNHSGQKCSACSLAILEAPVYDSPHFRRQLRDAAASLTVGSAWDLASKIVPLIAPANPALLRALTTLDAGEEWLLEPKQDSQNPQLWSPGIKLGVALGSFTHQTELFGPVLGLMRADNLEHAIELANGTPYGLTAGIHSLDEREQRLWIDSIEAGNCYINRSITGAIVQRQPFGGCKQSSFGGGAKAGGPNYLLQLMHRDEQNIADLENPLSDKVAALEVWIAEQQFSQEEQKLWRQSAHSYAFYWQCYFSHDHDPCAIVGQHNILRYRPHHQMTVRYQERDSLIDLLRVIAAVLTVDCPLTISYSNADLMPLVKADWMANTPLLTIKEESEEELCARAPARVRFISQPSQSLRKHLCENFCQIHDAAVLAHGRLELLNYLREISLSIDYHRYGNVPQVGGRVSN